MLKNKIFKHAADLRRVHAALIFLAVAALALAAFYPFSPANAQRGDFADQTVDKSFVGGGTGVIEICKAANGAGLENKIFRFTVSGVAGFIEVPVNACSAPIDVPVGPQTVTELANGRTIEPNGTFGTFSGGFLMVGAETLSQNSPSALGAVNLPARTVQINVAEGGIQQQLVLRITNTSAVRHYIEICPRSATVTGSGASVFLNYTIAGLAQRFVVPSNFCTGPIEVNLPASLGASPTVKITQLSNPNFTLQTAATAPSDRFNSLTLGSGIDNTNLNCLNALDPASTAGCVFANPGGGYADVDVIANSVQQMTVVYFDNRVEPGRLLKICKIAGAGVTIGTPFTFDFYVNGAPEIGAAPIVVPAGDAASGGNCVFAQGESAPFIMGTSSFPVNARVTVVERAVSGTAASAVNSPTGTTSDVNLSQRKATIAVADGVNILTFTNITAAPISAPTATGTNVSVAPTTNLNLTFGSVSTAGETTVSVVSPEQQQPLPSSFALSGSALVYQITTSAVSSGNIVVSFDVPGVADAATCARLRILHFTNGAWDASSNAAPQYKAATRICTVSQTVNNLSSLLAAAANAQSLAPSAASVFAVARLLAPTAATATISGRAMSARGRGISGVIIAMTDSNGATRTARTSAFGHFSFNAVAPGATYVLTAKAKRFVFAQNSRVLSVTADASGINFIANDFSATPN